MPLAITTQSDCDQCRRGGDDDGDGDVDDDGDIEVTCVKDREMRGWLLGGGGDVRWRGGCRSVGSQPSFSSGNNASDTGNTQRNDDLTNKLNTEHNLHFSPE